MLWERWVLPVLSDPLFELPAGFAEFVLLGGVAVGAGEVEVEGHDDVRGGCCCEWVGRQDGVVA
jgi:hypothetical protein